MNDPLYTALNATRPKDTSQCKKTALPPMRWIRRELKQFGTIDTPPTYKADLTGSHPFKRAAFGDEISDKRYEALEQSFRLAARLLNSARPYLCNFLPRTRVILSQNSEARVPINDTNRTTQEQVDASIALLQVIKNITWAEDPDMWSSYGTLGLTHTGLTEDLWEIFEFMNGEEPEELWDTASKEADRLGLPYRPLKITLASQMVDAIMSSEPNTEQHMNAVFQAGITITHELGHALFYCHKDEPGLTFWVGDDQLNETGHSFIAWLFGGFYPEPIHIENDRFFREFRGGHAWNKMPRRPSPERLALITYSMPMSHIQKILSTESWAPYDFENDPDVHIKVRNELLSPQLPFKNGKHARISYIFGKHGAWKNQPKYAGFNVQSLEEEDDEEEEEGGEEGISHPTRWPSRFVDEDWDDRGVATETAVKQEATTNKRKRFPDLTTELTHRESSRIARRRLNSPGDRMDIDLPPSPERREFLEARKYSDDEILYFLTHDPRFMPAFKSGGHPKESYVKQDIAQYYDKKFIDIPAEAAAEPTYKWDDPDEEARYEHRRRPPSEYEYIDYEYLEHEDFYISRRRPDWIVYSSNDDDEYSDVPRTGASDTDDKIYHSGDDDEEESFAPRRPVARPTELSDSSDDYNNRNNRYPGRRRKTF